MTGFEVLKLRRKICKTKKIKTDPYSNRSRKELSHWFVAMKQKGVILLCTWRGKKK